VTEFKDSSKVTKTAKSYLTGISTEVPKEIARIFRLSSNEMFTKKTTKGIIRIIRRQFLTTNHFVKVV